MKINKSFISKWLIYYQNFKNSIKYFLKLEKIYQVIAIQLAGDKSTLFSLTIPGFWEYIWAT